MCIIMSSNCISLTIENISIPRKKVLEERTLPKIEINLNLYNIIIIRMCVLFSCRYIFDPIKINRRIFFENNINRILMI